MIGQGKLLGGTDREAVTWRMSKSERAQEASGADVEVPKAWKTEKRGAKAKTWGRLSWDEAGKEENGETETINDSYE